MQALGPRTEECFGARKTLQPLGQGLAAAGLEAGAPNDR